MVAWLDGLSVSRHVLSFENTAEYVFVCVEYVPFAWWPVGRVSQLTVSSNACVCVFAAKDHDCDGTCPPEAGASFARLLFRRVSLRDGSSPCHNEPLSTRYTSRNLDNAGPSCGGHLACRNRHLGAYRLILLAEAAAMARTCWFLLQRHPRIIVQLGHFTMALLLHFRPSQTSP